MPRIDPNPMFMDGGMISDTYRIYINIFFTDSDYAVKIKFVEMITGQDIIISTNIDGMYDFTCAISQWIYDGCNSIMQFQFDACNMYMKCIVELNILNGMKITTYDLFGNIIKSVIIQLNKEYIVQLYENLNLDLQNFGYYFDDNISINLDEDD